MNKYSRITISLDEARRVFGGGVHTQDTEVETWELHRDLEPNEYICSGAEVEGLTPVYVNGSVLHAEIKYVNGGYNSGVWCGAGGWYFT